MLSQIKMALKGLGVYIPTKIWFGSKFTIPELSTVCFNRIGTTMYVAKRCRFVANYKKAPPELPNPTKGYVMTGKAPFYVFKEGNAIIWDIVLESAHHELKSKGHLRAVAVPLWINPTGNKKDGWHGWEWIIVVPPNSYAEVKITHHESECVLFLSEAIALRHCFGSETQAQVG